MRYEQVFLPEIVENLRERCDAAGGVAIWGRMMRVAAATIQNLLDGKSHRPGSRILAALGYERHPSYWKVIWK